MSKKKHSEEEGEHDNTERWLLTYSDMMTLLVAFFIMMYSMSVMNMKKFEEVAIAIRSGFGGQAVGKRGQYMIEKSVAMIGQESAETVVAEPEEEPQGKGDETYPAPSQKMQFIINQYVGVQLANLRLDEAIQPILDITESSGNRYVVILTDQIFFSKGESELTEDSRKKLAAVGRSVSEGGYKLTVAGYNSPLGSNSVVSGSWNLSGARATAAASFLVNEAKINPRRISVVSYGEWKDPGKSRRIAYSSSGEWQNLPIKASRDSEQDRVVISMIMD